MSPWRPSPTVRTPRDSQAGPGRPLRCRAIAVLAHSTGRRPFAGRRSSEYAKQSQSAPVAGRKPRARCAKQTQSGMGRMDAKWLMIKELDVSSQIAPPGKQSQSACPGGRLLLRVGLADTGRSAAKRDCTPWRRAGCFRLDNAAAGGYHLWLSELCIPVNWRCCRAL